MNEKPIGVFDSGVGGLTVLDELVKTLPSEDYIYVGDEANCPYGTKTNEEIEKCVVNVVTYLIKQDVKAIVIACNTASLFIDKLKTLTTIPIIDVINPTSNYASMQSKSKRIGVIATNATIKKGTYQKLLEEKNIKVYPVACSEFVDYIETKDINSNDAYMLVHQKLSCLQNTNIDTLIYGCTHFSILEKQIKEVVGKDVNYIACGYPTSIELLSILKANNLLNKSTNKSTIHIYTTGDISKTLKAMSWYNGPKNIEKIEI